MSWAESVYTINQVNDANKMLTINSRPPAYLTITWDGTNKIATLHIGVAKNVYLETYSGKTTLHTEADRLLVAKTVKFEIWRSNDSEITEYGQGTKIAVINKTSVGASTSYDDDLSEATGINMFYYAVFAVSETGHINVSEFVTCSFDLTNPMDTGFAVYGFIHNFEDGNPESNITYPQTFTDPDIDGLIYSFINYGYDPMNNVDYKDMDPGDWLYFLKNVLKNEPYMVKASDRTADYKLSDVDYMERADDSGLPSDAANSGYLGGAFSWIAKIYSKEVYGGNGAYRVCMYSDDPKALDYGFEPLGFLNPSNQELEGVWLPIGYTGSSGKNYIGLTGAVGQTTDAQNSMIKTLTSEAKFLGGPILRLLRDLEYMLFKSTDIQKHAGYGRCNAYSAESTYAIANQDIKGTGYTKNGVTTTDRSGTGFQGCTNSSNKRVPGKMFHSQVLGSYNYWIRDPYTINNAGILKVSKNYAYDLTGGSYINTGLSYTVDSWYYPKYMVKTAAGSEPKNNDNSGSTITGLCDGLRSSSSGVRVGLRLGYADTDLLDGPATLNLSGEASASHAAFGCATLLLPDPGYTPQA